MTLHRWQVRALCIAAIVTIGGVALVAGLVSIVASNLPAKMHAPHAEIAPARSDAAAQPILQFESHTCGLLALSAAYRLYGLSPAEENLRYRLGVDNLANPLDSTSTGTLHPDLFRVLVQDGFRYDSIDPTEIGAAAALATHLAGGDAALLLITRRENGNLHWVLTDACRDGTLRIVDSLAPAAYEESLETFLEECVLSIVALAPDPAPAPAEGTRSEGASHASTLARAHADGLAELARAQARLREK